MDLGKLKVKRLSDILAGLIDYTSMNTDEITDFTPGSIIRSIYEAVSMELEQLYLLSTENVTWAIDHAILDAFSFTPKEAQSSYGYVTVDLYTPLAQDVNLGRGTTVFSTEEGNKTLYFQTMQSYFIAAGTSSFKIEVYCTQAGEVGNIPANYIDAISSTQLSVMSVTNDDAFLTGRDGETAEELKKRFREFVATRGRATKRAVKYGIETVPEVVGCYIEEKTGVFYAYVHDANGDLPDDIYNKVVNAIDNDYRPVGIEWHILPVTKIKVPLQVNLAVTNVDLINDDFTDGLRKYIEDYLNHFKADDDLIVSEVLHKVLSYSSIITDVQFIGGATYTTTPEQIIRAGNIYITVSDKPNFNGANEIPKDGINDDTEEPEKPTTPADTSGGTKLLGFTYFNFSYNYSRTDNSTTPVSITYYDQDHSIITTLPYGVTIDVNNKNMKIVGNTYTLYSEQQPDIPFYSLSYDNEGSTYTTYDEKGNIAKKLVYDNYGRVTVSN